ncbi:MAG: hypothetical protein UX07_C0009G0021 [Parcubacteria group bacterium GW2011_GWA2_45_30]|nr:MAG: hypothetical protein UX07_C0009G0021 [Parcubacteria group bacterium GW2011_GWA2_45_30]
MTIATIERQLNELKERQSKLEAFFYAVIGNKTEEELEIRPDYLQRIDQIRHNMRGGKGITAIRTKKELKNFFRNL